MRAPFLGEIHNVRLGEIGDEHRGRALLDEALDHRLTDCSTRSRDDGGVSV
jgi:hypothetical protein